MEKEDQINLHGMWGSTFTKRVELALKLKGIPYEYIEEDLTNKSQLVLKYNPVHKQLPILVHNGKPIIESLIILEYIDETWKNAPRFLPDDSYERAKIRFWASFFNQQVRKFEPSFISDSRATTDYYYYYYYYYYYFFGLQLFEGVGRVVTTDGEAQEKATNDLFEKLKALEEWNEGILSRGQSYSFH